MAVQIPLGWLAAYALTLLRCTGALLLFPGMAPGEVVPVQITGMLAAVVAWPLTRALGPGALPATAAFALAGIENLLLGLLLALAARAIFSAAGLAGQLLGVTSGLSAAGAVSPLALPVPAVSNLFNLGVLALIFAAGGLRRLLAALARSLSLWPAVLPAGGLAHLTAGQVTVLMVAMLRLALGLATPVAAVEAGVLLALGLVNRAMPRVNMLVNGLPFQIAAFGLMLFVLAGPLAAALAALARAVVAAALNGL